MDKGIKSSCLIFLALKFILVIVSCSGLMSPRSPYLFNYSYGFSSLRETCLNSKFFMSTQSDIDSEHLHIHFGVGRLGIGLIVGSLDQGNKSYVLVQRPNRQWESSILNGMIDIKVNEKTVAEGLTVIQTMEEFKNFLSQPGRRKGFALTSDGDIINELCLNGKSFSVSLGSAFTSMISRLARLPCRVENERPTLYACENNHDTAKEVGKMLSQQIKLVCCMVDRICTGRYFSEGFVNVSAEEEFEGSLVLLNRNIEDDAKIPFGGPALVLPKNEKESHYFYDRKVSLVNGMHTCLAFMTLRIGQVPGKDYQLITYASADDSMRQELRAWAAVRCLMLLETYGSDVIKQAHNVETDEEVIDCLLDYSWEALNRFSKISDTTSRVLGGGVGNRWATRLWPVDKFAKGKVIDPTSLGGKLMAKAGVTPEFAKECCSALVKDGMVSCAEEMNACAKRLVDYYKRDNQASFPNRAHSSSDFPEPEKLVR